MWFLGRADPLTNPTVRTGPHRSGSRRSMGGTLTAGPARLSIVAAALLFVSSPWTRDPRNTPTVCSGYHSGALEGGRGRESSSISSPASTPSPRGWGDSHTGASP